MGRTKTMKHKSTELVNISTKTLINTLKNGGIFLFHDKTLNAGEGGATELRYYNGAFFQYGSGQSWKDQQPTEISNIDSFISKHKKQINKGIWL